MELKMRRLLVFGIVIVYYFVCSQGNKVVVSPPFPYDKIRLPGDIRPIHYQVRLHPNITNGKFDVTGKVTILLEAQNETDSIYFHSKSHTFVFVELTEAESLSKVPFERIQKNDPNEMVLIKLKNRLSAKKRYNLVLWFTGYLSSGLSGFYRSRYKTKKNETRYIATTHFEATGARYAFPCFDEPAMKATFSIIMIREARHSALSNMPIEKQFKRHDGLYEDHFQQSVKMSTYLVAFVVSDFAHLETTSRRGVKIRVWAPKDLISYAKYAIKITPKILDYYEKFYRINFPLPKQDLIAIPDFAMGAMENWGLITYRSTALLFDETKSSSSAKQWVAIVIAHELAHQWFGNLVTMKWWNDIWLNEGFAQFMENIGTNQVEKSWDIMDQFVIDNNHNALSLDSKINSHPISVPVKNPGEISALFDGISYSKGASVIRMMRDFIGDSSFLDGLAAYLKKHKYQNAESDDLWESLSAATHNEINVKKIMDTWILQMGYPLITVKRDQKHRNILVFTQERFLTDVVGNVTLKPSPFNYRWEVPLTYYFQHDRVLRRRWFSTADKSIEVPCSHDLGWIKVNVNEKGFYRVNYDTDNWNSLANQLKTDHMQLSNADRANLLNDVFVLANTGKIGFAQALDLTRYLYTEKGYVPFKSGLSALNSIGKLLINRPAYSFYEFYIRQQITPLVDELGWKDSGTHLDKFLRKLVLQNAVSCNISRAVETGKHMYSQWMIKNMSIPANLLSLVFESGIKYGGEAEWNYMFSKYMSTINPAEKNSFMYALTKSSELKILERYLKLTLDDKYVRSQNTPQVISMIARNTVGTKLVRNFVKGNWERLLKRCKTHIGDIISAVFSSGRTKQELTEARAFLNTHKLGSGKRNARRAIANIRNNISWLEKHESTVKQWLKNILLG